MLKQKWDDDIWWRKLQYNQQITSCCCKQVFLSHCLKVLSTLPTIAYLLARAGFLSCFCSTRIVPLNFYPLYLGVIAEEKFEARYLFSTGIQGRKVNILGYLSLSKKPFFCQKLEICLSWNFSSCSTAVESTRNNVFNVSQTFIRAMPNKVLEVEALSHSWKTPSKNVKEVKS